MFKIFARKRADILARADAIAVNLCILIDLVGLGDLAGVAAGRRCPSPQRP
jgi:hypothetical protein